MRLKDKGKRIMSIRIQIQNNGQKYKNQRKLNNILKNADI